MIAIETNLRVNIDAVDIYKKSKVEVELTQWRENKNGLFSDITYFQVSQRTEDVVTANEDGTTSTVSETYDVRKELVSRTIQISTEQYNNLCAYSESLFQNGMDFLQKQELRKKVSLLFYVTNDFLKDEDGNLTDKLIFGTIPSDWQIKE